MSDPLDEARAVAPHLEQHVDIATGALVRQVNRLIADGVDARAIVASLVTITVQVHASIEAQYPGRISDLESYLDEAQTAFALHQIAKQTKTEA